MAFCDTEITQLYTVNESVTIVACFAPYFIARFKPSSAASSSATLICILSSILLSHDASSTMLSFISMLASIAIEFASHQTLQHSTLSIDHLPCTGPCLDTLFRVSSNICSTFLLLHHLTCHQQRTSSCSCMQLVTSQLLGSDLSIYHMQKTNIFCTYAL